jgi:hypothetical protein
MRRPMYLSVGALLVLSGVVWTLQGLGYVEGSPMTGVTFWALAGPVVAAAGIAMVVLGLRHRTDR